MGMGREGLVGAVGQLGKGVSQPRGDALGLLRASIPLLNLAPEHSSHLQTQQLAPGWLLGA